MILEKFKIQKDTNIQYLSSELLFLAKSGQPYRGVVYISFKSIGETFDMLDFKKYITSLRAETYRSENIAFIIYTTINNSIQSKDLGIVVDLTARGGIQQRVSFGNYFEPIKKMNIFQI